jgi:hypothetical protein
MYVIMSIITSIIRPVVCPLLHLSCAHCCTYCVPIVAPVVHPLLCPLCIYCCIHHCTCHYVYYAPIIRSVVTSIISDLRTYGHTAHINGESRVAAAAGVHQLNDDKLRNVCSPYLHVVTSVLIDGWGAMIQYSITCAHADGDRDIHLP